MGSERIKRLEAAARAYYQVRPLHYVFKDGVSTPVPWEAMLSSKDSVRVDSLRRHRDAIKAAIHAFDPPASPGGKG